MSNSIEITKDLQELVLSSLITESHWYDIVCNEIDDTYFSELALKIIYKSLYRYHKKYHEHPSIDTLVVCIEENYINNQEITLAEVKEIAKKLSTPTDSSEDFLVQKIKDFIYKSRVSKNLFSFLESIKTESNPDIVDLYTNLTKNTEVNLSNDKVFSINANDILAAKRLAQGGEDNPTIIKSSFNGINGMMNFGGYCTSTVNMVVGAPGTGKSMFLFNEGASALKQGFEVLHVLIGDLTEYDGMIRYMSCLLNLAQVEIPRYTSEELTQIIRYANQALDNALERVDIVAYATNTKTPDELLSDIKAIEKNRNRNYSMVIIDYPDNLLKTTDNMYLAGGDIYGELEKLSRVLNTVVMVASQPKASYWGQEIIPLEGAAESSRKQQAVDSMLCLGAYNGNRANTFGSINIPKNRRGVLGILKYKSEFMNSQLFEVTDAEYKVLMCGANDK